MTDGPRTTIHQGLKSDGTIATNLSVETTTRMLFPITNQKYKLNSKNTFVIGLPFNFYGSSLVLKGELIVNCEEFVIINNRICAKLLTTMLIDERSLPKEITDANDILITGKGLHYFDIENSIFVYGNLNLKYLMKTKTRLSNSGIDLPGKDKNKDLFQNMEVEQTSIYELVNYK
jgi:hypothetical protein